LQMAAFLSGWCSRWPPFLQVCKFLNRLAMCRHLATVFCG
jgi:hypothetical protein